MMVGGTRVKTRCVGCERFGLMHTGTSEENANVTVCPQRALVDGS
jgi:hypothetical protein